MKKASPLAAAYAASDSDDTRTAQRLASISDSFRIDPQMEALIALRDNDPGAWESISPIQRLAAGYYAAAKNAAAQDAA